MTELDNELVPAVLEIVEAFGKVATARVKSGQAYDESAATVTETSTDYTVKILPPERFDVGYVDGDVIRASDLKSAVAASGLAFVPKPGMQVIFDGSTYLAVTVSPVYAGEQIAMWELQLRK
ncbi:head tail attachment protein [Caudoviricetes sp.]|nr:head tail attachment protein [Caudoviricetes sp.]UOF82738.1 head tail attachment protein [Caudoviricetes sp.]